LKRAQRASHREHGGGALALSAPPPSCLRLAYGQVTFGGRPTHAVDGNDFVSVCWTKIAPSPGRPAVEFTAVAVVGGMQNVFTDSPTDVPEAGVPPNEFA